MFIYKASFQYNKNTIQIYMANLHGTNFKEIQSVNVWLMYGNVW